MQPDRTGRRRHLHLLWLAPLLLVAVSGFNGFTAGADRVVVSGERADSVFAAGPDVLITADVDDDVIVAGGDVTLRDAAAEQVIAAGGWVRLEQVRARDLILLGGDVSVDAGVADDVLIAGGDVHLRKGTVVAGTATVASGKFVLDGEVAGDLRVAAGDVIIRGLVGGDAEIDAGRLRLAPGARIAGQLRHRGPEPARVAEGAVVMGGSQYVATEAEPGGGVLGAVWSAVLAALGLGLVGLVLHAVWPGLLPAAADCISTRPVAALGSGLALLIVTPVIVVVLMFTLIGLPLALMLLAGYAALLVPAVLVSASHLGLWARRRARPAPGPGDGLLMRSLLTCGGLFALALLAALPWVGGLIALLTLAFGLGALTLMARDAWRGGAA